MSKITQRQRRAVAKAINDLIDQRLHDIRRLRRSWELLGDNLDVTDSESQERINSQRAEIMERIEGMWHQVSAHETTLEAFLDNTTSQL